MNKLYVSSHGTIETEGTGMLQVRTDPCTHGPPAGRVLRGVCFCFLNVFRWILPTAVWVEVFWAPASCRKRFFSS